MNLLLNNTDGNETRPILYIHAGLPKTGSTSFQSIIPSNADLHRQGYHFFNSFLNEEGIGHHDILEDLISSPYYCAEQLHSEYLLYSETNLIHSCVLSTEGLSECFLDKKKFKPFVAWLQQLSQYFTLVPIIVLRDFSSYIPSIYVQNLINTTANLSPLTYAGHILFEYPIFIDSITEIVDAYSGTVILFYSNVVVKELFSIIFGDGVQYVESQIGVTLKTPYISFNMALKTLDSIMPIDFKNVILNQPKYKNKIDTFHDLLLNRSDLVDVMDELLVFNQNVELLKGIIWRRINNKSQDGLSANIVACRLNKNKLNAFFRYQVENFSMDRLISLETYWKCAQSSYIKYELINLLLSVYSEISVFLGISYPLYVEELKKNQHSLSNRYDVESDRETFYINKAINYISKKNLLGYGFHELEFTQESCFRWTGPETLSGLTFDGSRISKCEFYVEYCLPDNCASRLDFYINGEKIEAFIMDIYGLYTARIPYESTDFYRGPIVLEFKTDLVIDTEFDKRKRGLIISNISVISFEQDS